jgi:Sulfite exporter TauE/SafE
LRSGGLVVVGFVAGMSSGLLGIGGGLAITALGSAILKLRQHQAQALSLAITALPLTLPAAWSYVHQGTQVPALAIAGIVAGLWVGTSVGSRIANRLSARTLRYALVLLVAAMALFMAWKAGHVAEPRNQAATGAAAVAFAATRSASCRVHSAIFTASQPISVSTAAAMCIPWGSPRSMIALTPML